MKIHKLDSGATVVSLSAHPFRFSDGTETQGQDPELVSKFTLQRVYESRPPIAGMGVNTMKMILSDSQLVDLAKLCSLVDVVILPFPVLTALREQGVRDNFPNALAFNATAETQRSAPNDKVVDIDNWSY